MKNRRYVLVFREMYVKYIDGPVISTQKNIMGCLVFKSVKDAIKYALMNGISERYLNELEYQGIRLKTRKTTKTKQENE